MANINSCRVSRCLKQRRKTARLAGYGNSVATIRSASYVRQEASAEMRETEMLAMLTLIFTAAYTMHFTSAIIRP